MVYYLEVIIGSGSHYLVYNLVYNLYWILFEYFLEVIMWKSPRLGGKTYGGCLLGASWVPPGCLQMPSRCLQMPLRSLSDVPDASPS
jgi:hypothetical protein